MFCVWDHGLIEGPCEGSSCGEVDDSESLDANDMGGAYALGALRTSIKATTAPNKS